MSPGDITLPQVQMTDEGPAAILSGNCVALANHAVARSLCNQ